MRKNEKTIYHGGKNPTALGYKLSKAEQRAMAALIGQTMLDGAFTVRVCDKEAVVCMEPTSAKLDVKVPADVLAKLVAYGLVTVDGRVQLASNALSRYVDAVNLNSMG